MNPAIQRASEVAAMGPWEENTIDGASGVIYDRDGDGWDDMELADAANTLRTGYLACREREAAWEWMADNGYKVVKVDDRYVSLEVVEHNRTSPAGVHVVLKSKATAPDPVALAKALGWGGVAK